MIYYIEHKEVLVRHDEVEADNEKEAIEIYERMIGEGKIDITKLAVDDIVNKIVPPTIEVGDECVYTLDYLEKPQNYAPFVITFIYENGQYMNAVSMNGKVLDQVNIAYITKTGKHYDLPFIKN